MRLFAALLSAALLVGCGSDVRTTDARGELVIDQSIIEFPRTFVGYPTKADFVVKNTGFTRLSMQLAITGPYSMENGRPSIHGGAKEGLPVTFDPGRAGRHEGVLSVTIDGETREVLLVGLAEDPPACVPSGPCFVVEFDPKSGECVETMLPNDAPCESGNKCQVVEVCADGVCVGQQRNCFDDNVCTTDSCEPSIGCVSVDQSSSCPQTSNPCKVAICDRDDGCGFADAPDFTPCGDADCRTADVCIGGTCERVDVPDGIECIDECGLGKCKDGECERPEGDRLRQLWSYEPPAGNTVVFGGVSDGAGQLYWTESDRNGVTSLVSATPGGVIRYRAPTFFPGDVDERGVVLEEGLLLVAGAASPGVQAFLPSDGSSPWERTLGDELSAEVGGCPCLVSGGSLTRTETSRVAYAARVHRGAGGLATHTLVAVIRTGSGEVAWAQGFEGALAAPPVADELGNLYLLVEHLSPDPQEAELISIDPAGGERFRVPAARGAVPLSVWDERVQQAADVLLATADGARVGTLGYDDPNAAVPIHNEEGSYTFTTSPSGNLVARAFTASGSARGTLQLFDPLQLAGPLPPRWSEPALTRRNSALLSTSVPKIDGSYESLLVELHIDDDGAFEMRRACTLGMDAAVTGPFSLRAGKWVVHASEGAFTGIRSYEVPLADPAAHGWVGPLGNPLGGGRAQ